jgi:hypothetical protein
MGNVSVPHEVPELARVMGYGRTQVVVPDAAQGVGVSVANSRIRGSRIEINYRLHGVGNSPVA